MEERTFSVPGWGRTDGIVYHDGTMVNVTSYFITRGSVEGFSKNIIRRENTFCFILLILHPIQTTDLLTWFTLVSEHLLDNE